MIFEEFNGKNFTFLDWSICIDDKTNLKIKEAYNIGDEYQIFGSDICGDILSIKNGFLTIISHEEPTPNNDYILTNELDKVKLLFEKLDGVPDYLDIDNIKELKKIKKNCQRMFENFAKKYERNI